MRRTFEEPVLKKLLAKIELKFEDVRPLLGDLAGDQGQEFCLRSEADWQRFWQALNAEPVKSQNSKSGCRASRIGAKIL